jgi:hypothetical protein
VSATRYRPDALHLLAGDHFYQTDAPCSEPDCPAVSPRSRRAMAAATPVSPAAVERTNAVA